MSNAGSIFLINPEDERGATGIYLYTHWEGHLWPEKLRTALDFAQPRWHDSDYLIRILISRLFEGMENQHTGGGIGFTLCTPDYQVIVLDVVNQRVSFAQPGEEMSHCRRVCHLDFDDYIAQEKAAYPPR